MRVVAVVLGAIAVAVVAFNLATFAVAFRSAPRPPRLWRAIWREMIASLLLLPAWPFFLLLGAVYGARSTGKRPVVLVHGYAMNRTNWLWLGRKLAARGLGPLHGLSYFSPNAVADSAAKLGLYIERLCVDCGASEVDVVAHSLGGVIARYYIEKLGGAPRIRRLITIATPHRGTRWARFAVGRVRGDLAHESPLVVDLGPPRLPRPEITSIWSTCDNLVVPADSSRLGPGDVVFDDLGHLGLLTSPRVADAVAERLAA